MKAGLFRIEISQSTPFKLEDVLQMSIENYASQEVSLTLSDVITKIPKATTISGTTVPSLPYKIDSQVCPIELLMFNIDIPAGSGKVVVSYSKIIKQ